MAGSLSDDIYYARALGELYREQKEHGEVIIAKETDDLKRRALTVKFKERLEGIHLSAMKVVVDKTAREQFEAYKAGRR